MVLTEASTTIEANDVQNKTHKKRPGAFSSRESTAIIDLEI